MAGLQRILLAEELEVMPPPPPQPQPQDPSQGQKAPAARPQLPPAWALATVLRRVIFPLMTMLLNPLAGGKEAANETRVRVCSLATKFVLQHLTALSKYPDFLHLWQEVLAYLEQYMSYATSRHTASDLMCEALPELIKNLILVMMSSGLLSLESERGREIWKITHQPLTRISPEFASDIYKRLVETATAAAAAAKKKKEEEEKKEKEKEEKEKEKEKETEKVLEQKEQKEGESSEKTEGVLANDSQLPSATDNIKPPQTNEMI